MFDEETGHLQVVVGEVMEKQLQSCTLCVKQRKRDIKSIGMDKSSWS